MSMPLAWLSLGIFNDTRSQGLPRCHMYDYSHGLLVGVFEHDSHVPVHKKIYLHNRCMHLAAFEIPSIMLPPDTLLTGIPGCLNITPESAVLTSIYLAKSLALFVQLQASLLHSHKCANPAAPSLTCTQQNNTCRKFDDGEKKIRRS